MTGTAPKSRKAGAGAAKARPARRRSCPVCGRPAAKDFEPFCSRRCADADLGRWFEGGYRIPAVEPPDGFGEEADGTGGAGEDT